MARLKEQYKAGRVPGMTIEPEVPQDLLNKATVTICI